VCGFLFAVFGVFRCSESGFVFGNVSGNRGRPTRGGAATAGAAAARFEVRNSQSPVGRLLVRSLARAWCLESICEERDREEQPSQSVRVPVCPSVRFPAPGPGSVFSWHSVARTGRYRRVVSAADSDCHSSPADQRPIHRTCLLYTPQVRLMHRFNVTFYYVHHHQ